MLHSVVAVLLLRYLQALRQVLLLLLHAHNLHLRLLLEMLHLVLQHLGSGLLVVEQSFHLLDLLVFEL